MSNDYRLTKYCQDYIDIFQKKEELNQEIHEAHPRAKDVYRLIKNGSGYKTKFMDLYNNRCVYCGVTINVLVNIYLFEIDHFICKSKFKKDSDAGSLSNLVLSCRCCNRNKSNHSWQDNYNKILFPDNGKIKDLFVRDENYYIQISKDYLADDTIRKFYDKLRLGAEKRRLDYLLTEMKGLLNTLEKQEIKDGNIVKLYSCYNFLLSKRNTMG